MKMLLLADLERYSEERARNGIRQDWEGDASDYNILIGYESVGDYGCDSSAFYLLQHGETGKLYEVHGSHCSCCGFEGQWRPEETTVEYLKSKNFNFYTGGYDNNDEPNKDAVDAYIGEYL